MKRIPNRKGRDARRGCACSNIERGIEPEPMPDLDAHIHAFQDARTERASLDRINRAKSLWIEYIQGRAELELTLNKQTILLSTWRAEDRARRSSMVRPVVCSDCGARHLEHFYASRQAAQRCVRPASRDGLSGEYLDPPYLALLLRSCCRLRLNTKKTDWLIACEMCRCDDVCAIHAGDPDSLGGS